MIPSFALSAIQGENLEIVQQVVILSLVFPVSIFLNKIDTIFSQYSQAYSYHPPSSHIAPSASIAASFPCSSELDCSHESNSGAKIVNVSKGAHFEICSKAKADDRLRVHILSSLLYSSSEKSTESAASSSS